MLYLWIHRTATYKAEQGAPQGRRGVIILQSTALSKGSNQLVQCGLNLWAEGEGEGRALGAGRSEYGMCRTTGRSSSLPPSEGPTLPSHNKVMQCQTLVPVPVVPNKAKHK